MDQLVLEKIRYYIVKSLCSNKFMVIRDTLQNLSKVCKICNEIFNPNKIIYNYLHKNINDQLQFWPYKRASYGDLLNPARHDIHQLDYISEWRKCNYCRESIIKFICKCNYIDNPLISTSIKQEDISEFLCKSHFKDLSNRKRLKHWYKLNFKLSNELQFKETNKRILIKLEIITHPDSELWC